MKILVVEDDPIIQEGLRLALEQEGCDILAAESVSRAKQSLHENRDIDLCLLDIMLPDGTGYEVCTEIRAQGDIPVIFLTACDDEVHTVLALEQGGDDYITKPFRMRELMARIRAVLRRTGHHEENNMVRVGENEVNLRTGKIWRGKQEVLLTAMEYKLLLIFLNQQAGSASDRDGIQAASHLSESPRADSVARTAASPHLGCGGRLCDRQYADGLCQASESETGA